MLHLVRAQACASCIPGQLAPSVYYDIEADCGEPAVVTSSLSPDRCEELMRKNTQWMRDRLARMAQEKSPYERKRLVCQYYNTMREFIESAKPICLASGHAVVEQAVK